MVSRQGRQDLDVIEHLNIVMDFESISLMMVFQMRSGMVIDMMVFQKKRGHPVPSSVCSLNCELAHFF
jgi:hypothetical protein